MRIARLNQIMTPRRLGPVYICIGSRRGAGAGAREWFRSLHFETTTPQ